MADRSLIEWTDATWNPVIGCKVTSPGCIHCYAMRLAGTRLKHTPSREGLTLDSNAGPVWNGEVRFMPKWLAQPLHWTKPRDIFVCAHSDLFYEGVTQDMRDQIFAMMWLADWHHYQVLTKRPKVMAEYLADPLTLRRVYLWAIRLAKIHGAGEPKPFGWPMWHVIVGISAEKQGWFGDRIGPLRVLKYLGWRTWASLEPLLGPIDIANARGVLDWIVVGGESGPKARPMHPRWPHAIRDQCEEMGIPFFFKQWGEWAPVSEMSDAAIDACYHPAPERRPDATRRCKVATCVLHYNGRRFDRVENGAYAQGSGAMMTMAVGKKAAGALLNGRAWRETPHAR